MRIGCLMVTENRAPVVGISLASFRSQLLLIEAPPDELVTNATLLILDNSATVAAHAEVIGRVPETDPRLKTVYYAGSAYPPGVGSVPSRIDEGFGMLSDRYDCDVLCMWDDDDYSPPMRLQAIAHACATGAELTSYTAGWMVNLRTLDGQFFSRATDLWGSCLAFTRELWEQAAVERWSFGQFRCPGYDSEFVKAAREHDAAVREEVLAGDGETGPLVRPHPIIFTHGKNCSSRINDVTRNVGAEMEAQLPASVWAEVKRSQSFLIERRVYP